MGLRVSSLAVGAALLAAGLFAASPFFCKGLVGTGEAYNYGLSIADAVTQMRAGVIPPLAGQTEYAFNGRIHPLRNAPYLHYLAAAIDAATLHHLPFWQLQNISLALSIIGAVFACYAGLRWSTDCGRIAAVSLSALYILAPPVLSDVHTLNLFMTAHAVLFLPIAVAACIRGIRAPAFSADLLLAAALAAAWLAHPPVALWLTASVLVLRLVWFAERPSWAVLVNGVAGLGVATLLASFVFVSTATLSQSLEILSGDDALWDNFADVIVKNLAKALPDSLLPVTRMGGELGDIQFGYLPYLILVAALWLIFRRQPEPPAEQRTDRKLAGTTIAVTLGLLVLLMPVPGVTHFIWDHLPVMVYKLTTEWPVQRLYPIALAFLVFGTALALPPAWKDLKIARWQVALCAVLALGWTVYEAQAFIHRGFANRISLVDTVRGYQPSNRSLTITSYAYVGTPPTYEHGVTDPFYEFRLLTGGVDETASQMSAAVASAPVVASGELRSPGGLAQSEIVSSQTLKLQPHHRYLATFNFHTPPLHGLLYFVGSQLNRVYILPAAGEIKGFGMLPGQSRSIPIWTDSATAEEIQIHLWISDKASVPQGATEFAGFVLQDVNAGRLPVQVSSMFPLRFSVDAAVEGLTVETPRRFIPGYQAIVNGRPAATLQSPYGQVMIPLPPGHSSIELSYPGPRIVRWTFWLCGASWVAFLLGWILGLGRRLDAYAGLQRALRWARMHRNPLLYMTIAGLLAATLMILVRRQRAFQRDVGPIQIDFELPYGLKGQSGPLLSTGHLGAGAVVLATYVDETHVLVKADIWGTLLQSDPIALDYSKPHSLVVSDGALLPITNAAVAGLEPSERDYLRHELRVELDGRLLIHAACETFDSTKKEILIGRASFGSFTGPEFQGQILSARRLPIPRTILLPKSLEATFNLQFPTDRGGQRQPIVSILKGSNTRLLSATFDAGGQLQLVCYDTNGRVLGSAPVTYKIGAAHRVEVKYQDAAAPARSVDLKVDFDGIPTLTVPDDSPAEGAVILVAGLNMTANHNVDARFTGAQLTISTKPLQDAKDSPSGGGTADIVLTFPTDRPGRQEPVVTTGHTGAGDLIYVVYVDARHVKIGFDHWNGGGMVSEPIALDYRNPHELLVKMASLDPGNNAYGGVSVMVDGVQAINSKQSTYPSTPAEVTFGHNLIGGSTADRDFTGVIHFLVQGTQSVAGPQPSP
jgi:hypothetical protein